VARGFVLGGHLSAAIAAELAIAEPARWPRVVLDGSPTLLPAEMAHLLQRFAGLSPALSDDGAHRRFVWDMTERFLGEWDPDYRVTPETLPVQYAYMADYLQMGFAPIRAFIDPANSQKGGLGTYRALERWPLIEARVLAMTAEREALKPGHERAVALLRDVREHCFAGSHPIMNPARAAEYVDVVAAFLLAD
jgi:pimeloyl-ACP methyl ester carboxylesterase